MNRVAVAGDFGGACGSPMVIDVVPLRAQTPEGIEVTHRLIQKGMMFFV